MQSWIEIFDKLPLEVSTEAKTRDPLLNLRPRTAESGNPAEHRMPHSASESPPEVSKSVWDHSQTDICTHSDRVNQLGTYNMSISELYRSQQLSITYLPYSLTPKKSPRQPELLSRSNGMQWKHLQPFAQLFPAPDSPVMYVSGRNKPPRGPERSYTEII